MHLRSCKGYAALGLLALALGSAPSSAMGVKDALAHFESGATTDQRCAADAKIGSRREVSRFQILPHIWRQYGKNSDYKDPKTAWQVTERILADRYAWFRAATGRDWDAVDLYLMWNAPGLYERSDWNRRRISRVVLERAERFSNLLHSDDRVLVRGGQ